MKNDRPNPDHNIWNNNGTWWAHFTVHLPDRTKERVRVSLGTKDIAEARRQRDFIMRGTNAIVGQWSSPPFPVGKRGTSRSISWENDRRSGMRIPTVMASAIMGGALKKARLGEPAITARSITAS